MNIKSLKVPQPDFSLSNNELDAHHSFHVATTGGGKTSGLTKLGYIKESDQVAFYDPYGDYETIGRHKVQRFHSLAEFAKAMFKARNAPIAKPFKFAFTPKDGATQATLEAFSAICWATGNGYHKKPLHCVYEEFAKCVKTAGKLEGYTGHLVTGGRKFGLIGHFLFQRGQEVPKTVISSCPNKWVGAQERNQDAIYLSKEMGIDVNAITGLKKLDYIVRDHRHSEAGQYDKGRLSFRKKAA